eukprot:CAMPEP_0183312730 /NCGR_PEP_ID=MMETSP0160_2-20130417/42793_1 /TAXON_ID=2839 ORGANISM="Odontella Sinensis, Strain Grunow 1884" /NCGR_SAMPLE_ID=MMETSP0160_2 /ASSEMBLY_ACC=CAM_ASM_000250 /LENGTH=326 /DNA_ID=CAMNT_0025477639 /DNA_START=150 /DNA_END=1126 /DNA_ORIENTATION=+
MPMSFAGHSRRNKYMMIIGMLGLVLCFSSEYLLRLLVMPESAASNLIRSTAASNSTSSFPTFVIVCGHGETDTVKEMQPLLKSMILLASNPIQLVFVTDLKGAKSIARNVIPRLKQRRTHIHHIDIQTVASFRDGEEYADNIHLDLNNSHHSGNWGMLKVFLPWMLHEYDQFIVLDTDLIFVQDPILLWMEFRKLTNQQYYSMPLLQFNEAANMCSCVVLMQSKKIRESNIYPDLFLEALETAKPSYFVEELGKYRPHHGDQGIYYNLFKRHRDLVLDLDEKWNRDRCHLFNGAFEGEEAGWFFQKRKKEAGILHRNCDFLSGREG